MTAAPRLRALAVADPPRGRATAPAARRAAVAALLVTALALALTMTFLSGTRAAAAAGPCVPDAATACINGTLRGASGDPLADVRVTVEGGGTTIDLTSGADGRWETPATTAGQYTVTLDASTLPAGEALRDPQNNPRTVTVELGKLVPALFPMGAGTAAAPGTGSTAGTAPTPGTGAETPGSSGAATSGTSGDDTSDEGGDLTGAAPGESASTGVSSDRVIQQTVSGLRFGLLLALASIGLSLIYGTTGLSNFAHGEQVTLGGIMVYLFARDLGWPLLLSAVAAVAIGAASGWAQDRGLWGPLRRRGVGVTQMMIVTIGLSMAAQYLYQYFFGGSTLRIIKDNPTTWTIGPVTMTVQSYISMGIAVVTLVLVALFLQRTRIGRATRAVSDNTALAAASGINVDQIIRLVWTLGAGLAALAGVLLGLFLNGTGWNMGGQMLLLMFAAVTLGGLGTAYGALAGSLVIGMVVELSNLVIPSDLKYAGALVILILVLLVRPQGILGRAERVG